MSEAVRIFEVLYDQEVKGLHIVGWQDVGVSDSTEMYRLLRDPNVLVAAIKWDANPLIMERVGGKPIVIKDTRPK